MMNILTIIPVEFNYDNFIELYNKTNYDISDVLTDIIRDSSNTHFTIDDVNFSIEYDYLFGVNHCDYNVQLFIHYDDIDGSFLDKLYTDNNLKQRILDKIFLFVNDIKEKFNTISIPTDELDNIYYNENEDEFYIKLNHNMPTMLKLDCKCDLTIDDICWDI